MTVQTWPTDLPVTIFERDTWQLQPQDGRRKRQAEAGPPSYRRRTSRVPRFVSLSIVASRDQKERFWAFYHQDCVGGSLLFTMPDPSTDGWPMLTAAGSPLYDGAGNPLRLASSWLCAWGDQVPTETMTEQTRFRLSFSVVVMP